MSDELQFIITDAGTIATGNIAALESALGRILYPGDPNRNITLTESYIQAAFAAAINHAVNQSFLAFASGAALDALGVSVGITRKSAEPAQTTLRFTLGAARGSVTTIPAGTRATVSGSGVNFATNKVAEIPAGSTSVDIIASADVVGESGNGFLPGEITTLVDSIPYVASVYNLTASSDGSEPESDDSLRARIQAAPAAFSTAGPRDAYIAMTRNARADIEDVSVNSPGPRVLDIYFTLTGGAIPAQETIDEVYEYLNDDYRRPMSDVVNVHPPTPTNYNIELTYYISSADSSMLTSIQAAVSAAVDSYIIWQRGAIGRDVNPSKLVQMIMDAGALRVNVTSPVYAAVDYSHLAVVSGNPTVNYGGLVDE